jgi:hypothetical protein
MGDAWLRRWLFRGFLAVAAGLVGLLIVAPWLDTDTPEGIPARLVGLFGHDKALRRTCLAAAVGLAVTARVFFQTAGRPPRLPRRPRSSE